MEKRVVIMSGLPGSGKTTWIKQQRGSKVIVSADDYFMTEGGEYNFDPRQLPQAHQRCFKTFITVLLDEYVESTIYVDNTNLKAWEISPYYLAAEAFGYKPEIAVVHCNVESCIARNIHGVPGGTIVRMAKNADSLLERPAFSPWWKVTFVQTDDIHESEVE